MTERNEQQRLVQRIAAATGIEDERILDAFGKVPRHLFVPDSLRRVAYEDRALPWERSRPSANRAW